MFIGAMARAAGMDKQLGLSDRSLWKSLRYNKMGDLAFNRMEKAPEAPARSS